MVNEETVDVENEAHSIFLSRMSDDSVGGKADFHEGIRRVVS